MKNPKLQAVFAICAILISVASVIFSLSALHTLRSHSATYEVQCDAFDVVIRAHDLASATDADEAAEEYADSERCRSAG